MGYRRIVIKKFTLIELLLTISIIAILISLLHPTLNKILQNAHQTTCKNNLSHIGITTEFYTGDYEQWLPVAHRNWTDYNPAWPIELAPYLGLPFTSSSTMKTEGTSVACPSHDFKDYDLEPKYGGYAFNHLYLGHSTHPRMFLPDSPRYRQRRTSVTNPSETVYIGDSLNYYDIVDIKPIVFLKYLYPPSQQSSLPTVGYHRHVGLFNTLWVDGHVTNEAWLDMLEGKNGDINWYYKKEK